MSSEASECSVLLVDDDDVAAEAVMRGLRKQGMQGPIVVAEDGLVALEVLRGTHANRKISKPLLVLLDINMPRMSGIELLQAVRADPGLNDTVMFVLSTSGSDADRSRAYRHNIAGYLVKSGLGPQCSGLARFLTSYCATVLLP